MNTRIRYWAIGQIGLAAFGALMGGAVARIVLIIFAVLLTAGVASLVYSEHKYKEPR